MMTDDTIHTAASRHFLEECLFFNVNVLSRQLLKMAEAGFAPLKLSPAHASFLLILFENPGISPTRLGDLLQLTPSTITRFIDALEKKKLVTRKKAGRYLAIFPTEKGLGIKPAIAETYKTFYLTYIRMLAPEVARNLSRQIRQASGKLARIAPSEQDHDPDFQADH